MKTFALLGSSVAIAALAGVLLDVATFEVARYGPQADGWSFRGNGALSVPFGLGPAVLAGAWTALVARYRGFDRWPLIGLAAGLVGAAFLLISVLAVVLFNSDGSGVSNAMTFFILGWTVVAPWAVRFVRTPAEKVRRGQLGGHVIAGVAFAIMLFAVFIASALVLAPGS